MVVWKADYTVEKIKKYDRKNKIIINKNSQYAKLITQAKKEENRNRNGKKILMVVIRADYTVEKNVETG